MRRSKKLEYEFLPAALEIVETPPSPLGGISIWFVFLLVAAAFLWSYFGRVDEIAVARGRIITDGRLKVIQPLEEGTLTAIHIVEGERVKEGQLLIELDATMKQVDVSTLEKSIAAEKLEKEMLTAELAGRQAESVVGNTEAKGLPEEIVIFLNKLKVSREAEYKTKERSMHLVIAQNEDELNANVPLLMKLQKNYEFIAMQESTIRKLYESGSVPRMDWLAKQTELLSVASELEALKLRMTQIEDKLSEAKENLYILLHERESSLLSLILEKEKSIRSMEAELLKAQKQYKNQKLVSPVNGTVHGLAVNTIGGVVTPAQPVMTIVPEGTPLIVEANVLNKDIGFLSIGQTVELKVDTFPFQKYGIIKGVITFLSPDAVKDETLGYVYRMKASMDTTSMNINGKAINISSGMTVTAEIKTGKRKIIEFFISPIVKYTEESLKLR